MVGDIPGFDVPFAPRHIRCGSNGASVGSTAVQRLPPVPNGKSDPHKLPPAPHSEYYGAAPGCITKDLDSHFEQDQVPDFIRKFDGLLSGFRCGLEESFQESAKQVALVAEEQRQMHQECMAHLLSNHQRGAFLGAALESEQDASGDAVRPPRRYIMPDIVARRGPTPPNVTQPPMLFVGEASNRSDDDLGLPAELPNKTRVHIQNLNDTDSSSNDGERLPRNGSTSSLESSVHAHKSLASLGSDARNKVRLKLGLEPHSIFEKPFDHKASLEDAPIAGVIGKGVTAFFHTDPTASSMSLNTFGPTPSRIERVRVKLGKMLDSLALLCIVANTVTIGVQADWQANAWIGLTGEDSPPTEPLFFKGISVFFCCVFTVELLTRLCAHKMEFFRGPDQTWNVIDFLLVAIELVTIILEELADEGAVQHITMLRTIRIFRLVRMVRLFRIVRAFRELRIVIMSILSCFRSLISTLALFIMLIYMVSVLILVLIVPSAQDNYTLYDKDTEKGQMRLLLFSGLLRSMITVFQTATGGIDWADASKCLEELHPQIWILWCIYIAFTILALFNIVTGVFVDQAMKAAQDDLEFVMQEERDTHQKIVEKLTDTFAKFDTESEGRLTWEQLEHGFSDATVQAYFKQFDLQLWDVRTFFELIQQEHESSPQIDINTFIHGCLRLKGQAKNIDLVALRYKNEATWQLLVKTKTEISSVQKALKRVSVELRDLRGANYRSFSDGRIPSPRSVANGAEYQ